MQQREFSVQSVQEVAAKVDGARYLFCSIDLYRAALRMTVLTSSVDLCPMALLSVSGKVWGIGSDTNHDIEIASLEDVSRVVKLYDAESEEEKAARIAAENVTFGKFVVVKSDDKAPTKRWFRPVSESGMEAIESMDMEVAA